MTTAIGAIDDVHPTRAGWRPGGRAATLSRAPTLGAALLEWAAERPDDVAFYLYDMAGGYVELTVGALYGLAADAAAGFTECGIGPGDRITVSLDTGADLIVVLFGAVLLGAVPVLLEPPLAEGRARIWGRRVAHAIERVRPRLLVAGQDVHRYARPLADSAGIDLRAPSTVIGAAPRAAAQPTAVAPPADRDAVAVLQLTSGTLSSAKAATLTHRALFANAAAIAARTPYRTDDLLVSWLPLHHDMGLAGAVVSSFLHRIPVVLLPPMAFLLRPERWLWAVHRFRGTLSPAPSFAYQLCAVRVRDEALGGLDLSSWRVMFNGAEMVNAGTVRLWQERFGRYGARPESMRPGYGMAELGVAVTLTGPGQSPRIEYVDRETLTGSGLAAPAPPDGAGTWALVGAGRPLPGYDVRVVDRAGRPVADRTQGRVLVRGPSLMTGYFGDPETTAEAVRDGWLVTGDLGFLADGELFVTGRAGDLLIVAGRNYQPYAAEVAAAAVPGVRTGGAVVVGVPDPARGTDTVVVVVESTVAARAKERDAVAEAVSLAVTGELGLRPDRVLVVRPGTLPRTPSGKLRRARVTADLAAGGQPGTDCDAGGDRGGPRR